MTVFESPVPAPDGSRLVLMPGSARADSLSWMPRGACQGVDPELFFPIATAGRALGQVSSAKAVCGRCDVQASCLSYALNTGQHGIWGGTTEDERSAMRVSPARRAGRLAGGVVHLVRSGEERGLAARSVPSFPPQPAGPAA